MILKAKYVASPVLYLAGRNAELTTAEWAGKFAG
jgi:hypothetical protein